MIDCNAYIIIINSNSNAWRESPLSKLRMLLRHVIRIVLISGGSGKSLRRYADCNVNLLAHNASLKAVMIRVSISL